VEDHMRRDCPPRRTFRIGIANPQARKFRTYLEVPTREEVTSNNPVPLATIERGYSE
jgi:hypothetical protein